MTNDYITIGEIIKSLEGEAKITRQGLYYYEELGLIKPAIKTERFNLYDRSTIEQVKKIRELLISIITNDYHSTSNIFFGKVILF